jgi:hypothetical protein
MQSEPIVTLNGGGLYPVFYSGATEKPCTLLKETVSCSRLPVFSSLIITQWCTSSQPSADCRAVESTWLAQTMPTMGCGPDWEHLEERHRLPLVILKKAHLHLGQTLWFWSLFIGWNASMFQQMYKRFLESWSDLRKFIMYYHHP